MPNFKCLNVPVYTTAERYLGHVVDVEIEPTTQTVTCYHVAPRVTLPGLWNKKLTIARNQVVSLSPEKIVVQETEQKIPAASSPMVADPT